VRWLVVFAFVLFIGCKLHAQEFNAGFSYQYMVAGQWDEAIRTYNFSRTFVIEKQPLLESGIRGSLTALFNSKKRTKHGLNLSYSTFRSVSGEAGFKNILQLHFIQLGYVLHFGQLNDGRGFCTDLIVSAITSGLFRNGKGGAYEFDEGNPKAFGIGGDVCIKTGYGLPLKGRASLVPFIAIAYTPYLYSPQAESVLNQTTGLTGRPWTGIFSAQAGISVHFLKKQKP
jgi:hypothetical protein